jgi:hypothetical protein
MEILVKISGTPTLLLVDRSGTVLNAWIGMLSPRQELEVMRATTAPALRDLRARDRRSKTLYLKSLPPRMVRS